MRYRGEFATSKTPRIRAVCVMSLSGINFDIYVIYHYSGLSVISFCEELTVIPENNITQNRTPTISRGLQYSP